MHRYIMLNIFAHPRYVPVRTAVAVFSCWMAMLGAMPYGVQPSPLPGVAPADTMRVSITTGQVLTTMLPETVGETAVERYRLVEGLPFSGVARRSLVWPTANADPGTYDLVLVPATESPSDTLVVQVQVDTNG